MSISEFKSVISQARELTKKITNIEVEGDNNLIGKCNHADTDRIIADLEIFKEKFGVPLSVNDVKDNDNFSIITCTFSKKWSVSYEFYFTALGNDWYKKKPTSIPLQNILNLDGKIPLCNIRLVEKLAQCLYSNSVYQNDKAIVFFNEKAIKINFALDDIELKTKFIDFIRKINEEQRARIEDFITFMSNSTDKNNSEKWAIFAGQLKKHIDDKDELSFITFLHKLKLIKKETKISYESYLSDFSFSKFEKKLEEESEKISSKILDALKNIQAQIIGIPVLAIIPRLMSNSGILDNTVYLILLIFSVMTFFNILVSKDYLTFLKKELKAFSEKLSTDIQESFKDKQTRLNTIITSQYIMLYIYYLISLLGILYAIYCLRYG